MTLKNHIKWNDSVPGESRTYYVLYTIIVFLSTYNDTFLQKYLGFAGCTFIPVILFPLYVYFYCCKRLVNNNFSRTLLKLILWVLAVSVVAGVIFVLYDIPLVQKNESYTIKTAKVFILYFMYYAYISVVLTLLNKIRLEHVFKPFFYALMLLTVILFIEYSSMPMAFTKLHFSPPPYYRIRLLTGESSFTAPLLEVYGSMALYYSYVIKKSKYFLLLTITALFSQVILSGSKTLMVFIMMLLFMEFIKSLKYSSHITKKQIIGILTIFIGMFLFYKYMWTDLLHTFMLDIEEFTSTVTRAYSIFCGFVIGLVFPAGTGYAAYLYLLPRAFIEYQNVVYSINPDLNLSEILAYAYGRTGQSLTAKSFLGQSAMHWGIIGTVIFVKSLTKTLKKSIKKSNMPYSNIVKSFVLIIIIQLLLAINLSFDIMLFFICIFHLGRKIHFTYR